MRFKNETSCPTELLVAVIKNVLADVAKHEGRKFNRKLVTTIKYGKNGRLSGWARYDGTEMLIRLPRNQEIPIGHFAALVEHESLHLLGKKHGPGFGCTVTAAQNALQAARLADTFESTIPAKEQAPTLSLVAPEEALAYRDFMAHSGSF